MRLLQKLKLIIRIIKHKDEETDLWILQRENTYGKNMRRMRALIFERKRNFVTNSTEKSLKN